MPLDVRHGVFGIKYYDVITRKLNYLIKLLAFDGWLGS